jgi:urea transporter
VLPVAFLSPAELFTGAGGLAAAIAVGGFLGQVIAIALPASDQERREITAFGGCFGFLAMIGLIALSVEWR